MRQVFCYRLGIVRKSLQPWIVHPLTRPWHNGTGGHCCVIKDSQHARNAKQLPAGCSVAEDGCFSFICSEHSDPPCQCPCHQRCLPPTGSPWTAGHPSWLRCWSLCPSMSRIWVMVGAIAGSALAVASGFEAYKIWAARRKQSKRKHDSNDDDDDDDGNAGPPKLLTDPKRQHAAATDAQDRAQSRNRTVHCNVSMEGRAALMKCSTSAISIADAVVWLPPAQSKFDGTCALLDPRQRNTAWVMHGSAAHARCAQVLWVFRRRPRQREACISAAHIAVQLLCKGVSARVARIRTEE
jgi:hypothetical protein